MHLLSHLACGATLASAICAYTPQSTHATDELAAKGLKNLKVNVQKQLWNGDRD
jgi:hypothetical protein